MAKLDMMEEDDSHRVIIFGGPKTGKTELAMRLAEKFNVLYIGLENGHSTGLKLPKEWQKRIEVVNLPDTRDYSIGIETCLRISKGKLVHICDTHGKHDCMICKKIPDAKWTDVELDKLDKSWVVVFDSLTQLTNSAISKITFGKPEDYKLDFDDWRMLGVMMDMFLSRIQQAPYNVICISHESQVEMEDGKNKLVPTAGSQNFSRNTAKYFGTVIYAEIKMKKHVFSSGSTASTQALTGSRTGLTLESSTAPSLLELFKLPAAKKQEIAASSNQVTKSEKEKVSESTSKDDNSAAESNEILQRVEQVLGDKKNSVGENDKFDALASETAGENIGAKIVVAEVEVIDPVSGLKMLTQVEIAKLPIMEKLKYLKSPSAIRKE